MKQVVAILAFSIVLSACGPQNKPNLEKAPADTYIIKGTIKGVDQGLALFSYVVNREVKVDTSVIDKGNFSFTGKLPEPEEVQIAFSNAGYNAGIVFFAENSSIRIEADTAHLQQPVIEGSSSQKDLEAYYQQVAPVDKQAVLLNTYAQGLYATGKLSPAVIDSLRAVNQQLEDQRAGIILEFAKSHPQSMVSAWAITKKLLYDPKPAILEPAYGALSTNLKNSIYGTVINEAIQSAKATAIGQPAIDFTQADVNGKPITLSSFKGKYTLVDFWASWCGPCRAENPNVVKAYGQYHSSGFDILGVSLDEDKASWKAAIAKDKLQWTQVSDLKSWNNAASKAYGIKGIPFNVLLDKNGVIIAKNLRGIALETKLKELFNH